MNSNNGYNHRIDILVDKENNKKKRKMQFKPLTISAPTFGPGWYIVHDTPYGYQLLSGLFTNQKNAEDAYKARKAGWHKEEGWGEPELIRVEIKIKKED